MAGNPTNPKVLEILRKECAEMGHPEAAEHLKAKGYSYTSHSIGRLRRQHNIKWVNLQVTSKWYRTINEQANLDQLLARGLNEAYAIRLIKRGQL